jgi:hypothetical protein
MTKILTGDLVTVRTTYGTHFRGIVVGFGSDGLEMTDIDHESHYYFLYPNIAYIEV